MAAHRSTFFFLVPLVVLVGLIVGASAASAQNVPATAREAAKLPQYASRLAHAAAAAQQGSPASSAAQHGAAMGGRADRSGLMSAFERSYLPPDTLYSNGPINGSTDAWAINFGFVVTDSFPGGVPSVMTFGAWLFPGDVLQSVEVKIGSSPFGGDVSDQVVNFSQSSCSGNQYGFNVCVESGTINPGGQGGGGWVTLQNAIVNTGDPVYWDENSGPSMAAENSVGTIPSEAFTLQAGSPGCFTPRGNLQVIHDFTQRGGTNGVVLDNAGNLYGVTNSGGDNNAGFAYKLSRVANWLLDPLFSFMGGTSGGQPSGAIIGPNGTLYGGAQGGIQNCGYNGGGYCGLVFNLKPQPTACANATCGWTEKVLYRFTSESDGSETTNVSACDQQGNLYGTTSLGGASGAGTVFELMPSASGGWTKNTLYSFTGGIDGGTPTQVLWGNDGNLYGVATYGGINDSGVVFQLMFSSGQWTENLLYIFAGTDGFGPSNLVQDSAGNLYGTVHFRDGFYGGAGIFVLKRDFGWAFREFGLSHHCDGGLFHGEGVNNLIIDPGGAVYGTGSGGASFSGSSPPQDVCAFGYIFQARYDSDGWHYQDLEYLNAIFHTGGSLSLDSSGNLYGTTSDCGANNAGTVWQFTP
jgi:uncharacterized repeat protein (TIGR03803 family)